MALRSLWSHLLISLVVVLLHLVPMYAEDDLYDILGLPEDANERKIKGVFRRLSVKYHPDKYEGKSRDARAKAKEKFALIRKAYDVLSQPDLRAVYDSGGLDAVKEYEKTKGQTDPWGRPVQSFPQNDETIGTVKVSLADMYKGAEISHTIRRRRVCRGCKHYRANAGFPDRCRKCQRCPNEYETRMVRLRNGMMMRQQVEVKSQFRCTWERKHFAVEVEKGMTDGERITFKYAGNQDPGHLAGDVVLIVKQKSHSLYKRRGNNLYVDLKVSLREALTGIHKALHHLDGHSVKIDSRGKGGVIAPGSKWKIEGEGFPKRNFPSEFGSLIVKFDVDFPKKLTGDQLECVKGWPSLQDTPKTLGTRESAEARSTEDPDEDTPFQVTFVNEGGTAVDVYWDNGADGVYNVHLAAGETANVNTYSGHRFFSTLPGANLDQRRSASLRLRQILIERSISFYALNAEEHGHSEL